MKKNVAIAIMLNIAFAMFAFFKTIQLIKYDSWHFYAALTSTLIFLTFVVLIIVYNKPQFPLKRNR